MTYPSWEPRHRVTTVSPGKLDLLVVTLIDGRRASIDTVMEYEDALARALACIKGHPCQIKVLPFTADELWNYMGWKRAELPTQPADLSMRAMVVERLRHIARDSADHDARRDAFDELVNMGEMTR